METRQGRAPGVLCRSPGGFARAWTFVLRGIFLFMIANGAVVFVVGPRRVPGIAIIAALVWIWWGSRSVPD